MWVNRSSPAFTQGPAFTSIASTVPATRATTEVSIFMASMTATTWFSSTGSPGFTVSLEIIPGMEAPTWLLSSGSAMATGWTWTWALWSGTATVRAMPLRSKWTFRVPSSLRSPRPRYLMTRVLPSSMLILLVSPRAMPLKNTWLPMRMI